MTLSTELKSILGLYSLILLFARGKYQFNEQTKELEKINTEDSEKDKNGRSEN